MNIKKIVTSKWEENCYIVNNSTKDSLIIDPGCNAEEIIQYIKKNNLKVLAILNTHAHYDHIGAVNNLKEKFKIPFFLHSKDEKLLKSANFYRFLFDEDESISIPVIDNYYDRINTLVQLESFSVHVIFTPGHTEGSVCLRIEDCLFTGDILLHGSFGRVDLPGGDRLALIKSLKMIFNLPQELKIFPGHGEVTTLTYEFENNRNFIEAVKSEQ